MDMDLWLNKVKWNEDGLVPVVVQEIDTLKVLMHAWMNRTALKETIEKKQATYWSRSRQTLWTKGEESGHFQMIKTIHIDCDLDTLLLIVKQQGGIACHTGRHSCFFMKLVNGSWQITENVLKSPKTIYNKLT